MEIDDWLIFNISWQITLSWLAPTIFILLFLSAFFSAMETALTSINIIRIKNLAKTNKRQAKKAKRVYLLVKDYSITITTLLIANNLVNIALATFVTFFFDNQLGLPSHWSLIISTMFSLVIVLLFGEIIPKNIARWIPERLAISCSWVIVVVRLIFYPLAYMFSKIKLKSEHPSTTERELLELVKTIENEGVLEKQERHLITSAIIFDEKTVKTAMQSRDKVITINYNSSISDIKTLYRQERFTRVPVINSNTKVVKGILNVKDIIINTLDDESLTIPALLQKPLFLSKNTKLSVALEKMQKSKMHLAIVTSSKTKKDFIGIITMEDLIEELVGEIYDEHDATGKIYEIGHHKFQVVGTIKLKKLFQTLNESVPVTNAKSLNEWYREISGEAKITKKSPEFQYNNYIFRIIKVRNYYASFEIEVLSNNKTENWE
ncbi:hemolysin family protein [Spiroplasma endosymbiont of Clivina fossor]|uniref:hemolysin family protein n=1 Tax=Spiroplasma endosymbiont of Clivina fossor TaxID=3066282 RepID=UPI00313AA822